MPEDLDAKPNQARSEHYKKMVELVEAMPESMPDWLDSIFGGRAAQAGMARSNMFSPGYDRIPPLDLINSSVGDELLQDMPKFLDMEKLRERFWERFDAEKDTGFGLTHIHWHAGHFDTRIGNYLDGHADPGGVTAYQEFLLLCSSLTAGRRENREVRNAFLAGEPQWAGAAIEYVQAQSSTGAYAPGVGEQFYAFFRGPASDIRAREQAV